MTGSSSKTDDREHYVVLQKSVEEKPNFKEDWINLCVLIMLYMIQGFPVGYFLALSSMLQSKKMINYEQQAMFSIVLWPHTIKIMWAPIVDSFYVKRMGRRKSWLIPLQLLIGITNCLYVLLGVNFFILAYFTDDWLPESKKPNFPMVVFMIFIIHFLSATQDIVVEGWALTILKKKNVSYASTCHNMGIMLGHFIGSVCFTLLVSEDFNIKYLGSTPGTGGLVSMKSFLYFWVIIVFSATIIVGIFKKEKNCIDNQYKKTSILQNYKILLEIFMLPRIRVLAVALLTLKIGSITMDDAFKLKLIDAGVSNDNIMIINTTTYFVIFTIPIFVSKYITGLRPMSSYLNLIPYKLLLGIIFAIFIYYTPSLINNKRYVNFQIYYYMILDLLFLTNEAISTTMMLVLFAFFCRISDPQFGGTYMTFFNTFYFLGWFGSSTAILKLIDTFTYYQCSNDVQNVCSNNMALNYTCVANEESCGIYVDGYYIAVPICTIIGFIWYCTFKKTIQNYELLDTSCWSINVLQRNNEELAEPCIVSSI